MHAELYARSRLDPAEPGRQFSSPRGCLGVRENHMRDSAGFT